MTVIVASFSCSSWILVTLEVLEWNVRIPLCWVFSNYQLVSSKSQPEGERCHRIMVLTLQQRNTTKPLPSKPTLNHAKPSGLHRGARREDSAVWRLRESTEDSVIVVSFSYLCSSQSIVTVEPLEESWSYCCCFLTVRSFIHKLHVRASSMFCR